MQNFNLITQSTEFIQSQKLYQYSRIAFVEGKVGRAGRDCSKSTISVQSQKLDPNGGGLLWVVG